MPVSFQHELLAKARVELGLTQEDAARAVGVDVRTYRRYESGEVNEGGTFAQNRASRRRIVERMCRELGVEEAELLRPLDVPKATAFCLPRARHFVGRTEPLARLQGWLGDARSAARVLAVLAIGGAGKTSLLERVLASGSGQAELQPFVYSFYEEPSVDTCLSLAARHLGQSGAEPLDDVLRGLRRFPDAVLVLDGLEVVQADGEGERARGELIDRRLARLLRSVVRERSLGRLLLTSRFPITDLSAFEGAGLATLALPALDARETRALLEGWGARAGAAALDAVLAETGGHALSLSVIGSYAAALLDGDLGAASQLALSDAARDQPLARKLHAMLDRYAAELAPLERDLLASICIFPRGAELATLARLPGTEGAEEVELRAGLGRLVHRGLAVQLGARYSAHPFIRAHFANRHARAAEIHEQERTRLNRELEDQPLHRPRGHLQLERCERLFEHTLLAGDTAGAFRVLERTLGGFSHLGLRLGEFERGLRLVRALQRVAHQLPADEAWRVAYDRGLYSAALGDLDGALRAYRSLLDRDDTDATTHRTLAYTLRLSGDFAQAHLHLERSIALGRDESTAGTLARGLALRGALLTSERRLSEAGAAFDEARALGEVPTARRSIWEAEYFLACGDAARASAETLENLENCRIRGWAGHVAHCHVVLGRAAVAQGALGAAEEALDAALDWCRRSREVELTLEAQALELAIARAEGDAERAAQARGALLDAAIAGGYGTIRAVLEASP